LGSRIVEAHYERADEEAQAGGEILGVSDHAAFFKQSCCTEQAKSSGTRGSPEGCVRPTPTLESGQIKRFSVREAVRLFPSRETTRSTVLPCLMRSGLKFHRSNSEAGDPLICVIVSPA